MRVRKIEIRLPGSDNDDDDVYIWLMKKRTEERKKSMKSKNNNNKRVRYVLTYALLLSNITDDCSRDLMTSFNWQRNDVEKGKKTREKKGVSENEKKNDKALLCVRCNTDTNESADKKKKLKEKQFNDDSTYFLFFFSRLQVTFDYFALLWTILSWQNVFDLIVIACRLFSLLISTFLFRKRKIPGSFLACLKLSDLIWMIMMTTTVKDWCQE
jgi:hypothetical protein